MLGKYKYFLTSFCVALCVFSLSSHKNKGGEELALSHAPLDQLVLPKVMFIDWDIPLPIVGLFF